MKYSSSYYLDFGPDKCWTTAAAAAGGLRLGGRDRGRPLGPFAVAAAAAAANDSMTRTRTRMTWTVTVT